MKKIAFSLCLVMATLVTLSVPLLAHAPPNTSPTIGTPVIQPSSPTYNAPATVSVNVTDQHSKTIIYTTDNWKMVNTTLLASYNATTTTATAQIPALASGGHVAFYVVAFNGNGIKGVNDNSGSYFGYDVAAPPSLITTTNGWIVTGIILGSLGAFAVAALHFLRKPGTSSHSTN